MYSTLINLVDQLAGSALDGTAVLRWGAPVPAFGDPAVSRVATLGLNPSNREFVDEAGQELTGAARRFHTLGSLGLTNWEDSDAQHLELVLRSCRDYFRTNPYDGWFRKLDKLLAGTGTSFYATGSPVPSQLTPTPACHLDLIPYATRRKWMDLTPWQRARLLNRSGDALSVLLRTSAIRLLLLNGRSVVEQFEILAGIRLERTEISGCTLPRHSGMPVKGVGYSGIVCTVGGTQLSHELLVIGYNHNVQSSFGVTNDVMTSLRNWIAAMSEKWVIQ